MQKKLLIFYDGFCPLCQGSKNAIDKTDWFNRIRFLSFREPGVIEKYNLSGKKPEERICAIRLRDGKTYEGIGTILQIALRVPAYWMFVPVLYLLMLLRLGQPAYDFIAKRRKIIPVGQCGEKGCPVHKK